MKQMMLFKESLTSTQTGKTVSHKDAVLGHLKERSTITPMEALTVYGIFRLAPRIHELRRDGHKIQTILREDSVGKRYAQYKLL